MTFALVVFGEPPFEGAPTKLRLELAELPRRGDRVLFKALDDHVPCSKVYEVVEVCWVFQGSKELGYVAAPTVHVRLDHVEG